MQGIYLITNLLDGKRYVGRSVDIMKRWEDHIYSSYKGDGFLLHRAMAKYDETNFSFQILEIVPERNKLEERETYWYNKLNPEYNMIPPDGAPSIIQKLPVVGINMKTNERFVYDSINEAARQNNVTKTAIANVLKGKRNTANGLFWIYEGEERPFPVDLGNNGNRRVPIIAEKDDKILRFDSISDAARTLNVRASAVSRLLHKKGRAKRVKGYTIRRGDVIDDSN